MLLAHVWSLLGSVTPPSVRGLPARLRLICRAATNLRSIEVWNEELSGDAARTGRHFLLPITHEQPYINSRWDTPQKLRVVKEHYRLAETSMRLLGFDERVQLNLPTLETIHPQLKLVLDKPYWLRHEGECALNLFCDDVRIMTFTFSVGCADGGPVAYIGAVQGGASGPHIVDLNKQITRDAHGLRPRDLLFALLRIVCSELGVREIYAVSNSTALAYCSYFGNRKVNADFDTIFGEYGGNLDPETGFFHLSASVPRKDLSEIPSKKRAMYRRRYELLEFLQDDASRFMSGRLHSGVQVRPDMLESGSASFEHTW